MPRDLTSVEYEALKILREKNRWDEARKLEEALSGSAPEATLPADAVARLRRLPALEPGGRTVETMQAGAAANVAGQRLQQGAVTDAWAAERRRLIDLGVEEAEAEEQARKTVERTVERAVRAPGGFGIRTGDVAGAGGSPRAILEAFRPQPIARGPEYKKPETKAGQALAWALETTDKATGEVRESLPATALRGIGSLWQFVDVPVMQALTYEVDEQGRPLNPEDPAYKARQRVEAAIGPKAAAAASARLPTALAPAQRTQAGRGGAETGNYWQDVAQAIAAGRMLGDDLQALPELREGLGGGEAPWWIGLGVELLRPVAPLPVSPLLKGAAAGARAARTAKAVGGVVSAADIPRIASGALDSQTIAAKATDAAAPRVAALVTSTNPRDVDVVERIVAETQDSTPLRAAVLEARQATKGAAGTTVPRPQEAAERAARQVLLEAGAKAGLNDYILVTPTLAVARPAWERVGEPTLARTRIALAAAERGDTAPLRALADNRRLPTRTRERLLKAVSDLQATPQAATPALADAVLEAHAVLAGAGVGLRRTGELAERAAVPEALRWETARQVEDLIPAGVIRAGRKLAEALPQLRPAAKVEGPIELANAVARIRSQGGKIADALTGELKARRAAGLTPSQALDAVLREEGVTLGDAVRMMTGPAADDALEMLDVAYQLDRNTVATIEAMTKAQAALKERLPGALRYAADQRGRNVVTPLAGAWMQSRLRKLTEGELSNILQTPYGVGIPYPAGAPVGAVPKAVELLARGKLIALDPSALVAEDAVADLIEAGLLPRGTARAPGWLNDLDEAVTQKLFELGLYGEKELEELVPRLAAQTAQVDPQSVAVIGEGLANEIRSLAQQLSTAAVRKSLREQLPSDAKTAERVGTLVASSLMAMRRVMTQGMLGGLLLPNGRYLGVNLLTAPLIAATTLSVPDALRATGVTRLLSGELLRGKAPTDVVFTTPTGVKWTRDMVEQALSRNTLGTSRQAMEFAEAATAEFLRAAKLLETGEAASSSRQVGRWFNPIAKNVWSELADKSDRFFRENVFLTALSRGIPEAQAAKMAAESMLDYSSISRAERELVGQFILFWSFQRQMALATLRAAVNRPSLLARLARVQQATVREWTDGEGNPVIPEWYTSRPPIPGSRKPLLGERQGQRVAVKVGPSLPPLEPGSNLLLPLVQIFTYALGLGGTGADAEQAVKDLVFTPELSLMLAQPEGPEAGYYGRFPGQWFAISDKLPEKKAQWVRQQIIKEYELRPLPESRRREGMPNERVYEGPRGQSVQYGFGSKAGREKFLRHLYFATRFGVARTAEDYNKAFAVGDAEGPGAALLYGVGATTPVSASTVPIELKWKLGAAARELQALEAAAKKE